MPNEVTSPARSLNPMRVRSLGRRRHRTASRSYLEEKRDAWTEVFSNLGRRAPFHVEWDRGWSVMGRARGVRAGASERAGLLTSLGTKSPLYFKRTLR